MGGISGVRRSPALPGHLGLYLIELTDLRWRTDARSSPPEPITEHAGTKPEATPATAEGLLRIEDRCLRGGARFRFSYTRSVMVSSLC